MKINVLLSKNGEDNHASETHESARFWVVDRDLPEGQQTIGSVVVMVRTVWGTSATPEQLQALREVASAAAGSAESMILLSMVKETPT